MSRAPAIPGAGPVVPVLLVVEDHDAARTFVVRFFRMMGWETIEATTVPEALEVVADVGRLIDLVILDLMLPGEAEQDGTVVCRAIRAGGFPARVYAWTACHDGDPRLASAVEAGVDGVLIKPFTGPEQFRAVALASMPAAARSPIAPVIPQGPKP